MSSEQEILELGGLTLAHAFLILTKLEPDELLCPFAVVEGEEGREILEFPADTQEIAVENGKRYLETPEYGISRIAFARDGRCLTESLEYIDAISVSLRNIKSDYETTFSQFYQFTDHGLTFLGDIEFMLGSEADNPEQARIHKSLIDAGIATHPTAAELVTELQANRLPLPPLLEQSGMLQ
ncbi:hypothetical protein [uncultured Sphingorhabdus sp.]|uniref:hypothetical protein n=1 Tax=uncultured Sphingorhabdus sp. TaxID=1686106 RepID=UPI002625EE8D|nr:hypothetical protein [uncultured Sphingorhabdus sp.]HMS21406.1 hypothetical protein [Sphingorhabdus sp.]